MGFPTPYARQNDYVSYQNANPTRPLPGSYVNADLNAVAISIDEIVAFLANFSRADGRLANGSVGVDQLDASLTVGFSLPTTWASSTAYTTNSTVFHSNKFWLCNTAHTSTATFDETKWDEIVDFGAQADAAAASAAEAAAAVADAMVTLQAYVDDQLAAAIASISSSAATLTNKTIDGDDNTIQDIATSSLKTRTGADASVVTGTAGADGYLAAWNTDGDLVGAGYVMGTKAVVETLSVPSVVLAIRTTGYAEDGDGGDQLYKRVGSEPAHDGKMQSLDGAWWEIVDAVLKAKAFGAKFDGSTNDAAAIISACETAHARGGGVVELPLGEASNSVTSGVTCILLENLENVTIRGQGPGATVLKVAAGVGGMLLSLKQFTNVTVENLTLDGGVTWTGSQFNWTATVVTGSGHGLRGEDIDGLTVRNVEIRNCYSYGIGLEDGFIQRVNINNVYIHDVGADGIDVKNKSVAGINGNSFITNTQVKRWGMRSDLSQQAGIDLRGPWVTKGIIISDPGRTDAHGWRARFGEEPVANGTFDTDTEWTKGLGWTISGGVATHSTGTESTLSQTSPTIVNGTSCEVTFTITARTAGSVKIRLGTVDGTWRTTPGTYTETIVADGSTIAIVGSDDFVGSVDNLGIDDGLNGAGGHNSSLTGFDIRMDGATTGVGISATARDVAIADGYIRGCQDAINTGVSSERLKVTNVTIEDVTDDAFVLTDAADGSTISNCSVVDCGDTAFNVTGDEISIITPYVDGADEFLIAQAGCDNLRVYNPRVQGLLTRAIQVVATATNVLVRDGVFLGSNLTVLDSGTNTVVDNNEGLTDIGSALPSNVPLLNAEDQMLTGGVRVTSKDLGTISSGTVTPDPGDRPQQHYTNGGAHALAPHAQGGTYQLDITNNASAGAISTAGWTKVIGDSFDTVNGHKWRCVGSIGNAGSLLSITALF